jgi:hypothetical protein
MSKLVHLAGNIATPIVLVDGSPSREIGICDAPHGVWRKAVHYVVCDLRWTLAKSIINGGGGGVMKGTITTISITSRIDSNCCNSINNVSHAAGTNTVVHRHKIKLVVTAVFVLR